MSHRAINFVINEAKFPKDVKAPARWLMVHIADHENKLTGQCNPSHKTLAEEAGMSPRAVLDQLFVLENAGMIERVPNFRDGKRTSDQINIIYPPTAINAAPNGDENAHEQLRQMASEDTNVAARNQGIEPGNRTSVVIQARDPFDVWWDAYPRKVAKVAARKAWNGAVPKISALTLATFMERTRAFADHVVGKDAEHIAHPATWLNGERWNDELPDRSQTDGQSTRPAGGVDRGEQRAAARLQAMEQGFRYAADPRSGRRRWKV